MRLRLLSLVLALSPLGSCGGGGTTPDAYSLPGLTPDPAVQTGCLTTAPPAGQSRAKVIECAGELATGRMAAGRIGDLILENAKVRVVIRGLGEGFYAHGTAGGAIVDATVVGGEDILQELQPLFDFSAGGFDEIVITEAGDDGSAEIIVRGRAQPVGLLQILSPTPDIIVQQRYVLDPDDTAVQMYIRTYPVAGGTEVTASLLDAMFAGGRLRPFYPNSGFTDDGATAGVFVASEGTTSSYGLVYSRDSQTVLPLLELSSVRFFTGPSITTGQSEVLRHFVIGDGSVASVAERAWEIYGEPTGTVSGQSAPGASIWLLDSNDKGVTVGRAQTDGSFRVAAPAGAYTLRAQDVGRTPGTDVPVTVVAGQDVSADAPAGPQGALTVNVQDNNGSPLPARVLIQWTGGERIDWTDASGTNTIALPPGTYMVSVSRGMEYDAFTDAALIIGDDQTAVLNATLTRVLNTDGWIAVDTHIHSEMSTDSAEPLDDRLLAVAGEGVEIPISTDHDFVTDYGQVIVDLGLGDWLATLVGQETSTLAFGHINAWPMTVNPDAAAAGAVAWHGLAPPDIYRNLRAGDATRIVQVNHPRRSSTDMFSAIKLDPATLIAEIMSTDFPNADFNDFNFDAIEVGNAKTRSTFEPAFTDWMAFVNAGHEMAATGSSDSHGAGAYIGRSRTYVWVGLGNDDPATIDPLVINDALRNMNAVVAQGIFVTAGVVVNTVTSIPGDIVDRSAAADVTIAIKVQAPPWFPVSEIKIYERDTMILSIPIDPGNTAVVRYDMQHTFPLAANTDTLFVVRVEPGGDGFPVLGTLGPSFTNPVYVDVDGNGRFDP